MFKTFFGIMLLLLGGLIFFNVLGLGWLVRIIISILIVSYAINKMKHAETSTEKGFGIVALIIGVLLFFGGVHMIFGLLIGLALIYFGFNMMNRDKKSSATKETFAVCGNTGSIQEDAFDLEWNKKMKK